jgi:plastocyanin
MRSFAKVFLITTLLAVSATGAALATDHTVLMNGDYGGAMFFDPPTLVITVGDRVRWTNVQAVLHTATSGFECIPNGAWGSGQLAPGATSGYVLFSTVGNQPYYCRFHCEFGMVGQIIVEAPPIATRPSTWGRVKALYATTK